MMDPKLGMRCVVVLERLPETRSSGKRNSIATTPVKGRRRIRRIVDSDEESEMDFPKNPICWIPRENLTEGGSDCPNASVVEQTERPVFVSRRVKTETTTIISISAASKFIVEKFTNKSEGTMLPLQTTSSQNNSENSTFTQTRNFVSLQNCDDDIIILSSDDESVFVENSTENSLEDCDPLSDRLPVEEETEESSNKKSLEEDKNEMESLKKKSKLETNAEEIARLKSLVESGRFSQKGKTTLPTEAKALYPSEKKRLNYSVSLLATSNDTTSSCTKFRRGKGKSNTSRSVRAKMCKQQDLEGYVRSLKEAPKNSSTVQPSTKVVEPTSVMGKMSKSLTIRSPSPIPRTCTQNFRQVLVKAKLTKKSRADLLADDIVNNVANCHEGKKETLSEKRAAVRIPKKQIKKLNDERLPKTGSNPNSRAGASTQKDKHPPLQEGLNVEQGVEKCGLSEATDCNEKSYTFKKLTKRVAREFPSIYADGNSNETKSMYSKKPAHRPKDAIQPLSRNRTFSQTLASKSSPAILSKNHEKTNDPSRWRQSTSDQLTGATGLCYYKRSILNYYGHLGFQYCCRKRVRFAAKDYIREIEPRTRRSYTNR